MEIIEYFASAEQGRWLKEIQKSDWRAGQYLYELLRDRRLKELCGQNTKVLLLTDGEQLVSFCTYAEQDDVREPSLTPWVGFVYTFPAFRGKRHMGQLLDYAAGLAREEGQEAVYISTGETGLYEKYGYSFWKMMKDINGEDSRVYRKEVQKMQLYHTGYQIIRKPDVHYGRKNADFGQGFYLTAHDEFAGKWAKERKGQQVILNTYEMDLTGLNIHRFSRDAAWYDYIFRNRAGIRDTFEADVIIGPIANDTIYDTLGILTSGLLKKEEALQLLMIGPEYEQIALKTEKAAEQLTWKSARIIAPEEIAAFRESLAKEQEEYLRAIGAAIENM